MHASSCSGACLACSPKSGARAQLSFYTTIDMALRNSPQVRMGAAEVARAEAGVIGKRWRLQAQPYARLESRMDLRLPPRPA